MEPSSSSLFNSTSRLAGEAAARSSSSRRIKILHLLTQRPRTLFECAAEMGLHDHQISGRFTQLRYDGLIEITGERRRKPGTGCEAEVYRLVDRSKPGVGAAPQPDLAAKLGYPDVLIIGDIGELHRTRATVRDTDLPGIPYGAFGSIRQSWQVELLECLGCGRPLHLVETTIAGKTVRTYHCGIKDCHHVLELMMVRKPGDVPMPALVRRHL